jgi:hypothetical protein
MHNVNLTTLQMHTIIAALDDLRGDYFERVYLADSKGHESRATNYYDISQEYETIILALQAQMKGTNNA